jgi:hypothetical protein
MLAQGATNPTEPQSAVPVALADAIEELTRALERARRLLGRRSATRRDELAEGLRELTAAAAVVLDLLAEESDTLSELYR